MTKDKNATNKDVIDDHKDAIADKEKGAFDDKDKNATLILMIIIPSRPNESFCESPPCLQNLPTATWQPS